MRQTTEQKQKVIAWTLLLLFAIVLLSIIPFFRFAQYGGNPAGGISYYHMRMGTYVIENGIPEFDPATVIEQEYNFDPFHIVLGLMGKMIGISTAAILLPSLLGIITIVCMYNILQIQFPIRKQRLLVSIFILISPIFLRVFTEITTPAWISTTMALGIFCLLQKTKIKWASIPLLSLLLFYDMFHSVIAVLFIWLITKKEKKVAGIISCILGGGILVKLITGGIPRLGQFPFLKPMYIVQTFFADIGATYGFSLFAIILTVIGIQYMWRDHEIKQKSIALVVLLFALTIFINPFYGVYLNIFICAIAATGFLRLTKKEWKMEKLRNITLFLLILGVVYSGTAVVAKMTTSSPTEEMIEGLSWIKENTDNDITVLSSPSFSFLIQEQTERKVVINGFLARGEEEREARKDISDILGSRRIDKTMGIVDKYGIDYIIIFEEMKTGKIWDTEGQGLQFLLENGVNFKKRFENNKVTVWEVVRDEL
jgi:hypothetical protein